MNPTIKTAIDIVGSQKKLGEACDFSTGGLQVAAQQSKGIA